MYFQLCLSNKNKCSVVHYFCKVAQSYHYYLAGHLILPVENVFDLGVHFDSSLRFECNCGQFSFICWSLLTGPSVGGALKVG